MKKSTNAEIQERVDLCIDMYAQRLHKSEMKRRLREKFGDLSARQIDRYASRAREVIQKAANCDRAEQAGKALNFYESVLRDPKARISDKIRAQERIDVLLGLEAPKRTELTGAEGVPLIPELPEDAERALQLVYGNSKATPPEAPKLPPGRNGDAW